MGIGSRSLKWATRECGCQLLEKANRLADQDQKKGPALAYARKVQAKWGCGGKNPPQGPLPRDREMVRTQVGVALRAELQPNQCPFRCLYVGTEWVSEVVTADGLARESKVPWADALGRPLTYVDVVAIETLNRTRAVVQDLERKYDRAERKRKGQPYPGDEDDEE